jgi:hypothetical protein
MEVLRAGELYEYAVLVTALEEDVLGVAQLYRDRAETENVFDELKNQWGWAGFTTQDHQRCQILARIVALIYNWWSLFTRLAIPNRHTEATTSRPQPPLADSPDSIEDGPRPIRHWRPWRRAPLFFRFILPRESIHSLADVQVQDGRVAAELIDDCEFDVLKNVEILVFVESHVAPPSV